MIKKLIACVLFLFSTLLSWSQAEIDSLSSEDDISCEEIAYNSTYLISKYYKNHDYDSALLVLNDWQSECGASEPIYRTRILLAINDHAFNETIYDSTMVDYVLNYMNRIEAKNPEQLYKNYQYYFGYVPIRGNYDYFTQNLADTLLLREFDNPLELFFCQLYANILPAPLKEIQKDTIYRNTNFRSYYLNEVNKYLSKPDFHLGFFSGIWVPTGNASILGVHPQIGAQVGIKMQKMTYNLSMSFKFINTPDDYLILREGDIDTTRYFFGGYIGAGIERQLLKSKKHELSLLAGAGYDGFDAINKNLEDDDTNNDVGHSINSFNANFGLSYRYFYKMKKYIGIEAKYNFVNYNNKGGTNLLGDCYTFSLSIGGFSNQDKDYNLEELRYSE
jgi:hypothetical protein